MTEDKVKNAEEAQAIMKDALSKLNDELGAELASLLGGAIVSLEMTVAKSTNLEFRPPNSGVALNLLVQLQSTLNQVEAKSGIPVLQVPPVIG